MAKLVGLFGKASGRKGDAVLAVSNGQQIMRQYNPIVANPNTDKQVSVRSRMKLMSQLAATFASIIAIQQEKNKTPRNLFCKTNFGLTTFDSNMAQINLKDVQLTKSSIAFPLFLVDRSDSQNIAVRLSEANVKDLDAVVYCLVVMNQGGRFHPGPSIMVTRRNDSDTFAGLLPYTDRSIVVYAYGIKFANSIARNKFTDMRGSAATHVASLIAERSVAITDSQFTATAGAILNFGENTGDSSASDRSVLSINVVGNGTATGAGNYPTGTVVTCVATPSQGASFEGWYEDGHEVSTNPTYQVTLNANLVLEAHFTGQSQTYTVQAMASPSVGGSVSGAGTYNAGATVTLQAVANTDYTFVEWQEDGQRIGTNDTLSFTLNANRRITAVFEHDSGQLHIEASATPSAGGTVSGGGDYQNGDSVTLTVSLNTGYSVTDWQKLNGSTWNTVSGSAGQSSITFTASENAAYRVRLAGGGEE